MIDTDVMQDRIREANPIPHVENLDAEELARFVAAAQARRATVMQASTQHPTPTTPPTAPPSRRHRVWAFAAAFVFVLVVVGAAALLLRSDDPQVTEPAPSTTMAVTPTEPSLVESFVWSRAPGDQPGLGGPRRRLVQGWIASLSSAMLSSRSGRPLRARQCGLPQTA